MGTSYVRGASVCVGTPYEHGVCTPLDEYPVAQDAVPALRALLDNAVSEETCFLWWCDDYHSADNARERIATLIISVAWRTSPTISYPRWTTECVHGECGNVRHAQPTPVIDQQALSSARRLIDSYSDGPGFSFSEVQAAFISWSNVQVALREYPSDHP